MKKNIYDYTFESLTEYLKVNDKPFRAKQIYQWLYEKRKLSFDQMSNIPKSLQDKFDEEFYLGLPEIKTKQVSRDGTRKYLLQLADGECIETVLMRYKYGNSVCVTSQVGCNMGCTFCASGLIKKKRDLTAGEMVAQIMVVAQDLLEDEPEERVSHVVVMGTGEPFDNYDNVVDFLKVINNPFGLAIGARHITVSTCGIIPKIEEYSDLGMQVNLAISLHASNDEIRDEIMPINKVYSISDLIPAIMRYIKKTNRRVTIEYILLEGINDELKHARELANMLRGLNVYVNLIPYNAVDENGYKKTSESNVMEFFDTLKKKQINVTVRKEFGQDIDAACGQLRVTSSRHE